MLLGHCKNVQKKKKKVCVATHTFSCKFLFPKRLPSYKKKFFCALRFLRILLLIVSKNFMCQSFVFHVISTHEITWVLLKISFFLKYSGKRC